ncbi:hypothetical protein WJX77_012320 [Trebouxia sp. C0004]
MEPARSPDVNVTDVFREISQNILRYNYRPHPEDVIGIRDCCIELSKLPAIELAVGGVGGWLVGSVLGRRVPAASIGMFLCYNAFDRTSTSESCLHRIMDLPTPLGAEATAVVKSKDENSRHLKQVNELSVKPPRIATGAASASLPSTTGRKLPLQRQYEGTGAATQQDEPLWTTADPFNFCSDATESVQGAQPQADAKSQMEERRRKRQEAYRQRRELRKQQRQGVLLHDVDHQDIFSHQSK